ncbi:RNase adaptor protein RapZ, partial [Desulfovibrio sp. OttesenSCG-928-G15]|nr:RNase adaptor protein RapZ [Desulfovibrio sp. OttesenSCG-928-G15]
MAVEKTPPVSAADNVPVVVITGLSGSGKSTALAVFEDMGFFTVDGLPAFFAPKLADMVAHQDFSYRGLALGMDLRQTDFERELNSALISLRQAGFSPRIIFLEAEQGILLKRYASTRRVHPLEKEGFGLEQAIENERYRIRHL